jgi:hypothetical protein
VLAASAATGILMASRLRVRGVERIASTADI